MDFPSSESPSRAKPGLRGIATLLAIDLRSPRPWCARRRTRERAVVRAPLPKLGVDLVAVKRVREVFDKQPGLADTVFTAEELRYANAQRRRFEHLAARYAAKEAVLKALGTGLTGEMDWREIETTHTAWGEPQIALRGAVARLAASKGLRRSSVSLTHSGSYALAAVLLTG